MAEGARAPYHMPYDMVSVDHMAYTISHYMAYTRCHIIWYLLISLSLSPSLPPKSLPSPPILSKERGWGGLWAERGRGRDRETEGGRGVGGRRRESESTERKREREREYLGQGRGQTVRRGQPAASPDGDCNWDTCLYIGPENDTRFSFRHYILIHSHGPATYIVHCILIHTRRPARSDLSCWPTHSRMHSVWKQWPHSSRVAHCPSCGCE